MESAKEAEKIVLGACLIDSSLIDYVFAKLDSSDFTITITTKIAIAISNLIKKKPTSKIDVPSIYSELLSCYGEGNYFDCFILLMDSVPSTCHLDQYISSIKKASFLRKIQQKCLDTIKELEKPTIEPSEKIKDLQDDLDELQKHQVDELPFKTVGEITETVLSNTEEAYKKGEKILGLDTGFDSLNDIINGLQKNNLIIIAARPAVGKSSLALNIATHVAEKGKSVAYFSLEMSSEQLVQRLISTYSNVSLSQIQNGDLKESDWSQLIYAKNKIEKLPIYLDQTMAYSVGEIKSKCMQLKAQNQLDCIVIDYLQLITAEKVGNRVDEVGYISRELKKIAQTLEVPVIALSQLSRSIENRQDKTPQLSDLRESGSIEQDADIVMFLYRDTNTDTFVSEGLPVSLKVAKNRQGRLGTVGLIFNGKYSRFIEH